MTQVVGSLLPMLEAQIMFLAPSFGFGLSTTSAMASILGSESTDELWFSLSLSHSPSASQMKKSTQIQKRVNLDLLESTGR